MNFASQVEVFQNEDLNCRSFRISVDRLLKFFFILYQSVNMKKDGVY